MAFTFGFFHDSALTTPITSLAPLTATEKTDGSLPDTDKVIYFGSTASGTKAQVLADPGVDPIEVSIADSAGGSGAPATEFKLALSSGGLASAVAGAPLEIGTQVLSGVANAIPIHTRRTSALTTVGVYTDLSIKTQELQEVPV